MPKRLHCNYYLCILFWKSKAEA